MKVYEFPFSVAYSDTDASGFMYHGAYIEIAERARMEMVGGAKFPDGARGFVVRELAIKYIKPLVLADKFVVKTRITKIGNASLSVEQKFVKDGETYAILTGTAAYMGANLKPVKIPEKILKYMTE